MTGSVEFLFLEFAGNYHIVAPDYIYDSGLSQWKRADSSVFDLETNTFRFFQDAYISLTFKPAECPQMGSVIEGCISDTTHKVSLLFRTEHIQLFSAKEIIIENLILNGKENIYFVGKPEYSTGFVAGGLACFNNPNQPCCKDDLQPEYPACTKFLDFSLTRLTFLENYKCYEEARLTSVL